MSVQPSALWYDEIISPYDEIISPYDEIISPCMMTLPSSAVSSVVHESNHHGRHYHQPELHPRNHLKH
jgi:hypothetical protein